MNFKGKNNPNWKGGLPHCIDCGKQLKYYNRKRCKKCSIKFYIGINASNYKKGIPKCKDCNKILGDRRSKRCSHCNIIYLHKVKLIDNTGKNNGAYIDGKSYIMYSSEFNETLKELIRNRDNRICQLCNKKEKELNRALDVHHIDYNKMNCKKNNLISLCIKCHMKTNHNRDYYFAYFTYKIQK